MTYTNLINIRTYFTCFLLILIVNTVLYSFVYGDFSVESYFESGQGWGDQLIYFNESVDGTGVRLTSGVNLYPLLMYTAFPESMFWSILINSAMFALAVYYLRKEKKRFSFLYFTLSMPVIFYFSIGFTKETLLVLGFVMLNRYISYNNSRFAFFGFMLLLVGRPLFAIAVLPLFSDFFRRNIKTMFFLAIALTPAYFWVIKLVFSGSFYADRYSNFENTLRLYMPFLSIVGNFIAVAKSYLELFFTDTLETINNMQHYILFSFWFAGFAFMTANAARLFNARSCMFALIILVISMGPVSHFRYLVPVLLVWGYSVLPKLPQRYSGLSYYMVKTTSVDSTLITSSSHSK